MQANPRIAILFLTLLAMPGVYAAAVIQHYPQDQSVRSYGTVWFICESPGAASMQLYTNTTGSWSPLGTSVSGNYLQQQYNLQEGTYEWACQSTDGASTVVEGPRWEFTIRLRSARDTFLTELWQPFDRTASTSYPQGWNPYGKATSYRFSDSIAALGTSAMTSFYSLNQDSYADWAEKTGQSVHVYSDALGFSYVRTGATVALMGGTPQSHIQNLVSLYGNEVSNHAWFIGNELYQWGATAVQREGAYQRHAEVVRFFHQYDPTRPVYASQAGSSENVLRHAREVRPDWLLVSGEASLRPLWVTTSEQAFQDGIEHHVQRAEKFQAASESYGIPWAYSVPTNYWEGNLTTYPELSATVFTLLAHGAKGFEWFVGSAPESLIWLNQLPSISQSFTGWSPGYDGGRLWQTQPDQTANGVLSISTSEKHGGQNSAHYHFYGTDVQILSLFRVYTKPNAGGISNILTRLRPNTKYTFSAYIKTQGLNDPFDEARVQVIGSDPGEYFYHYGQKISGDSDWTQSSVNFTTDAAGTMKYGFFLTTRKQDTDTAGDVYFDDVSLVEDGSTENLLDAINPGFEVLSEPDGTPRQPVYGYVQSFNALFDRIGPTLMKLERKEAWSTTKPYARSVLNASATSAGIANVEIGVFTHNESGDTYVIVANRNPEYTASLTLSIPRAHQLTVNEIVNQNVQQYPSDGGKVVIFEQLPPGEGRVYHLVGYQYPQTIYTPLYSEDFNDGVADGWPAVTLVPDEDGIALDLQDAQTIFQAQSYTDFVLSFRQRYLLDQNPAAFTYYYFRSSNPATRYQISLLQDPGAESSTGVISLDRIMPGGNTLVCWSVFEAILQDTAYHSLRLEAKANRFRFFIDGELQFDCLDDPVFALSTGAVGFSTISGGHVRIDNITIQAFSTAETCNDGIQNQDETDIDCGGSCPACPTCSDGSQNGDETGIDCGGSCAPCAVICSLPNDQDPCDCIDNGELSANTLNWFQGTLSLRDFIDVLQARLTCST